MQGVRGEWYSVPTPGGGVSARSGAAAAVDSSTGHLLVFGGMASDASLNDGAELVAAKWCAAWQPLPRAGAMPTPRQGHSLAWDATGRRAVLFGGSDEATQTDLGDTLAYVPADGSWHLRACGGVGGHACMAGESRLLHSPAGGLTTG
jgi:hypothetical protein